VAILDPSTDGEVDVRFTFGQVAIDRAVVDYSGSCGNIAAVIGPWALQEKVVAPVEPVTRVRVVNTNTGKRFVAHVPVRNGTPFSRGNYGVDGVPRPGARIDLEFLNPAGSVTGSLFPTGHLRDVIRLEGREIEVSLLDVGNPTALVPAAHLGLPPEALTDAIQQDPDLRALLLAVREAAAVMAGVTRADGSVPDHIPKVAVVAPPGDYQALGGRAVASEEMDLRAWALTMGQLHQAYPITAAMPTAVASLVEGTVLAEVATPAGPTVRIGHPSGVVDVGAVVSQGPEGPSVDRVVVGRTARKIMEGLLVLP